MAWAAVGTMVAGTVMSAYSQIQQGRYQRQMYKQQAKMGEYESQVEQQRADLDIKRMKEETRKLKSRQRISYLKSGVQLSGSALDLLAETSIKAREDERLRQHEADIFKWRSRTKGMYLKSKGSQARYAGSLGGTATLMSGASKSYGAYKKWI